MDFEFDREWSSIWGRFEPAPEFDYMDEMVRNNVDEFFCDQGIWWWFPYGDGISIRDYLDFSVRTHSGKIEYEIVTARPLTDVAFEVGVFSQARFVGGQLLPKIEYLGRSRFLDR